MYKKSIAKRIRILESAKKVFVEKGYSVVTMKDISIASKVSRSGLYHYFSSAKDVF